MTSENEKSENELAIHANNMPDRRIPEGMTREQIELIKRTIAKGATDDELNLFIQFCRAKKMDPFSRQLYAIQRRTKDSSGNYHNIMVIQTGIDGFRAQAGRNPHYAGQLGPFWCGADGVWTDIWLKTEPPAAAKVGALRSDFKEPCWGTARWAEYKSDQGLWSKMPATMIAKCAEALALRKAFPDELSGVYSTEEMDQAIDVTPIQTSEAGAGQRGENKASPSPNTQRPAPAPVQPKDDEMGGAQGNAQTEPAGGRAGAATGISPRQQAAQSTLKVTPDASPAPPADPKKPATRGLLPAQVRLVFARARNAGLAQGTRR